MYIHICMCRCIYVCICIGMCVYIYIYVHICVFIYINKHTHMYIHIHIYRLESVYRQVARRHPRVSDLTTNISACANGPSTWTDVPIAYFARRFQIEALFHAT